MGAWREENLGVSGGGKETRGRWPGHPVSLGSADISSKHVPRRPAIWAHQRLIPQFAGTAIHQIITGEHPRMCSPRMKAENGLPDNAFATRMFYPSGCHHVVGLSVPLSTGSASEVFENRSGRP
jgi:hypothetical protein